jgi:micrococcal nuclease
MYEYHCKVRRVVDGDTVDVDIDLGFGVILSNQRVRLWGIDAPESRTRDLAEKQLGKDATKFLESKLGETCILRTKLDKKGKFGRILGEFYTNSFEVSINEQMINAGHAKRYEP